jgi:DNA-binding response OmpR family regulator
MSAVAPPRLRDVLLVEDDDDIRFLLRFWVESDERCGAVFEATDPQVAIELAVQHSVQSVVLDYMLTGGTALDCLAQIRASLPDARIIVYTANRRVAEEAGVLDCGADFLVEKMTVVVEDVASLVLAADSD